ncbi:LamG-like jellyroll fold domain-containing protein [Kitasatospora mediocidica]|uniref:LamG-like jellyroll fold domain-containing protein n=1 Tax=Kitasatospora mediocidica TaxID=58352 RepID=UPI000569BBA5|nr:LamG-like jellyroll fold domain-containing protein [Kitasatospora mediocidica]
MQSTHADTTSDPLSAASVAAANTARAADLPPASAAATAIAQAKTTGKSVPIPSLSTEYSETVATPAGHLSETRHVDQQRLKQNGAWVTLDPSLAANPDGTLSPKAAANKVSLSGDGTGPLATLSSADGKQLSISSPFPLTTPILKGATALYPNVAPDTDLQVTVTKEGGFATVLVIKSAQAAANPALKTLHWPTSTVGVTVKTDSSGGLTATDDTNTTVFAAPTPLMWDSSTTAPTAPAGTAGTATPAGTANSRSAGAHLAVAADAPGTPSATPSPDTSAPAPASTADHPGPAATTATMPVATDSTGIDLTPDQGILTSPTTKYPVFLDPDWIHSIAGFQSWTWVRSGYPGQNFNNDSHPLGVGRCGNYATGPRCTPDDVERTYYQFDISGYSGDVIHSATLTTNESTSADWSCSNTYPVNLFQTWAIDSTTTWNNQAQQPNYLATKQIPGSGGSTCNGNVPVAWDVTGSIQTGVGAANWHTVAFMLQGDENNINALKYFDHSPSLTIDYDRVPLTPTNPHLAPVAPHIAPADSPATANVQTCNGEPSTSWGWLGAGSEQGGAVTLNATVSSQTQAQVQTWSHIWDYTNNGQEVYSGLSAPVANNSNASLALPAGSLQDGHGYGYGMSADDGVAGVSWSPPTSTCTFLVDLTNPQLSFPTVNSDGLTAAQLAAHQFPPSGNGQAPQSFAGQLGYVPFTAVDPNPSGHMASGVACAKWGWDPQLADGTWHCGSAFPGAAGIPVVPGHWGTNILFVQVMDNANNVSPIGSYAFYAPWNPNGTPPVFGDITGDGAPDIVAPDTAGNLRAYTVPGNPVATSPATIIASPSILSPDNVNWADFQLTHRGALTGGKAVDDVFAHKTNDSVLYHFDNPDGTAIPGKLGKNESINKPAVCTVAPANPVNTSCAGYTTDWSNTLSIAALGDPMTTDLEPSMQFKNATALLTTERNATGDAALWYYPVTGGSFQHPVMLSATGWANIDLISPGDWSQQADQNGTRHPGLWARDRNTGDLRAYTFSTGTPSYTDTRIDPVTHATTSVTSTGPSVTGIATNTVIGNVNSKTFPTIGSDGDLTGNGHSSLWAVSNTGSIQVWTGHPTGTPTAPGYGWDTGPTAIASTGMPVYEWKLDGPKPGQPQPLDINGANPLTINATGASPYSWGPDHNGTSNAAATFANGNYLQAGIPALDTTQSYSVSAWAMVNNTSDYQTVVCLAGNQRSPFYLQYSKALGNWAFVATGSDDINTPVYYSATADNTKTPLQVGKWTLLTATYNADTKAMTLYINGQAAGSGYNPAPWKTTGPTIFGASAATGYNLTNQLNGSIGDVRLYPFTLTNEQIRNIFRSS